MTPQSQSGMSAEDDLNAAFALLHAGYPNKAKFHFEQIWARPTATSVDRFVALKGITNAMDALGHYQEAETVWVTRLPQVSKVRSHQQIARPRQAAAPNSGRGLLWVLGGLLALAVLTD